MWMTRFHYHSFQSCWGFCFVFRFAGFLSVTGLCVPSPKHQMQDRLHRARWRGSHYFTGSHTQARALLRAWRGVWARGRGAVLVFQCRVWYCAILPFSRDQQEKASPRLSVLAYQTSMVFICKHQALETSRAHKLVPSHFWKEEAHSPTEAEFVHSSLPIHP